ncbi:MAG: hypothetical protein ACREVE_17985 [Gammaproteobacteria bacterium]
MNSSAKIVLGFALALALIEPASAYIGPGAGLSLLGAMWGLLTAVLAAIAFVIAWPVRRMLAARRPRAAADSPHTDEVADPSADRPKSPHERRAR